MLESQTRPNSWWEDRTQAAPAYAWSAEDAAAPFTAAAPSPEPTRRWPRIAFTVAGTGAAAAAIAAAVVAFSGSDAHTAMPATAPVVASTPTSAPAAPAAMPTPAPAPVRTPVAVVAPRQQAGYSQPSSSSASVHHCPPRPYTEPSSTSDSSDSYRQHSESWQPSHDSSSRQSQQWNFLRTQFGHFGHHRSSSDHDNS